MENNTDISTNSEQYPVTLRNGQRKVGGPPLNWNGSPPKKGSEVFVGKLPRDLMEDSLLPLFQTVGTVYEMRLMMDFNGYNRGYAFVTFSQPSDAIRAIQQLNNYEIRPKRFIGVIKSRDNCRLFVGGIPKDKTEEDIKREMSQLTDGIVNVILYSSIADKSRNRGYAFVEYESHRSAAVARRKCAPNRLQLWGKTVAVDWAEPEPMVDEEILSKVRILYVRNLMVSTKEEELEKLFNDASDSGVEKVKVLNDFAFVHFSSRQQAQQAMETLQNSELNGTRIQITWAKPVTGKKPIQRALMDRNQQMIFMNNVLPTPGWTSHRHHFPYNPLFAPHHVPSYLPYHPHYQLPYYQRPALENYLGNRERMTPNIARLNRPTAVISPSPPSENGIAHQPNGSVMYGEEVHNTSPLTNGHQSVNNVEALTALCQLRNLGEPVFEVYQSGDNNGYLAKVSIPHLGPPVNQFQAFEACEAEEDARQVIAGCALNHLNQTQHQFNNGLAALNSQIANLSLSHVDQAAGAHPESTTFVGAT